MQEGKQTSDYLSPGVARDIVIIGAGPAGLTAAYQLAKSGHKSIVLEADDIVGGLSRTPNIDGWRFDIGGHRFFTKVSAVSDLWREILGPEDFFKRPRLSRIYYGGKFFDYPLKPFNALRKLGFLEALRCVLSYLGVKIRPPKDQSKFEGYVAARFGWRLYRIFFKTYTEKVWGIPANELEADWAAQRIKNLNLFSAIASAIWPAKNRKTITTLIEEFDYPRLGPGMMWERCAQIVASHNSTIALNTKVNAIKHFGGLATEVVATNSMGEQVHRCSNVVSSMPLGELLQAMDPPAPIDVVEASNQLKFRDFLTIALVVPKEDGFEDNWIYVHSPDVRVGRVQNVGAWSRHMIPDPLKTCLVLEYFVKTSDELWNMADDDLVALASRELVSLNLLEESRIERGFVVRMPKAYPLYDANYKANIEKIRAWLRANVSNVYPIGRNGMHRYNNQDHSMLTAILSVENLLDGASHDVWEVNMEADYHETHKSAGGKGG